MAAMPFPTNVKKDCRRPTTGKRTPVTLSALDTRSISGCIAGPPAATRTVAPGNLYWTTERP